MALRPLFRVMLLLPLLAGLIPAQPASAARAQARKPLPGVYLLDDWSNRAAQLSWAQGSVVHEGWQQVEPEEGRFDFQRIDRWLESVGQSGKRGILGIMLRCEDNMAGQDACTPPWALAWDPVLVAGKARLNYLDERVQQQVGQLASALAHHYAGNPALAAVQIDLGFGGTASPCPTASSVPGQAEECAAYRARYEPAGDGWQNYARRVLTAYGESFQTAGGQDHTPLQVVIGGKFLKPQERDAVVDTALQYGIGLHDQELAASFLTGEYQTSGCDGNEPDAGEAAPSHWRVMEKYAGTVATSFQLSQWPRRSERALTDEENAWWSALNALDKGASTIFVGLEDARWAEAWQFFNRYAGRSQRTQPAEAWIALRGAPDTWCGDAGDYAWHMVRRAGAAGSSASFLSASQPGGRSTGGWQGAYARVTDVAAGRPAFYFDLADDLLHGGERVVMVEVTYWDGTPEMAGTTWELAYDSAGLANQIAGTVSLRGTGRWLVHPFLLVDATFRNRLPDAGGKAGSDLRLAATGAGDVRFHMVRVKVLADGNEAATRVAATAAAPAKAARASVTAIATPEPATPALQGERSAPVPQLAPQAQATPRAAGPDGPAASIDVLRYQANAGSGLVADTYVAGDQPGENYGTANSLILRGDGTRRALLRFELSDIPTNARVSVAWLELTVVGRGRPGVMEVQAYPISKTWTAGESNWELAANGQPWTQPGLGAGMDREAAGAATLVLPATGLAMAPLTELVQRWISQPESNHGVLLQSSLTSGQPDLEYFIASSEWRTALSRPRLRIRLAGKAAETYQPTVMASPAPREPAGLATPQPNGTADAGELMLRRTPQPPAPTAVTTATVRIVAVRPSAAEDGKTDITAYIYGPDGSSPACAWQPTVRLWGAAGQQPARQLGTATRRMVEVAGRTFPAWDFAAVDVSTARGNEKILHLFATIDGVAADHSIVTLGDEVGTLYPQPEAPTALAQGAIEAVDASIEILWPHGGGTITNTQRANLSVALFRHGTREVLPAGGEFVPAIRLHWSINDGPDQAGTQALQAKPRLIQTPWLTYYLWDLVDIDVSAARESGHYVNFWVEVPGVTSYSNVWSHGHGPRPELQAPPPGTSCR